MFMMHSKEKGFSLIELLFVIMVIGILIVIAGSFSSSFSSRRNVDSVTNSISSNIQISKLQAARDGVQHRVSLSITGSILEIVRERGDSNTVSSNWTELARQKVKLENKLIVELPNEEDPTVPVIFKPTASVQFEPADPSEIPYTCVVKPDNSANYKRCGQVSVSTFGIIEIIKGNWDGSNCNQIGDG